MNEHEVKDVRHTEIHTAEPLVPEPSAFEVELVAENLKSHKSTGIDQITVELIKVGDRTIHCEIQGRRLRVASGATAPGPALERAPHFRPMSLSSYILR